MSNEWRVWMDEKYKIKNGDKLECNINRFL
jgi:hypothetical protein